MNLPDELISLASEFFKERIEKPLTLDPIYSPIAGLVVKQEHLYRLMLICRSTLMICMALMNKNKNSSITLANFYKVCLPTMS